MRNSGEFQRVAGSKDNVRLFLPRKRWETVKRQGSSAIQSWIDEGLKGSGVTVVLIGQHTSERPWVRYEIEESERQQKGMLGVYVDGIRDISTQLYGVRGNNPFNHASISKSYRTYDWVRDKGYDNFSDWVEQAAQDAKR